MLVTVPSSHLRSFLWPDGPVPSEHVVVTHQGQSTAGTRVCFVLTRSRRLPQTLALKGSSGPPVQALPRACPSPATVLPPVGVGVAGDQAPPVFQASAALRL